MCISLIASYPIFADFQKSFAGEIIDPNHLIKLELIGKGKNSIVCLINYIITLCSYIASIICIIIIIAITQVKYFSF